VHRHPTGYGTKEAGSGPESTPASGHPIKPSRTESNIQNPVNKQAKTNTAVIKRCECVKIMYRIDSNTRQETSRNTKTVAKRITHTVQYPPSKPQATQLKGTATCTSATAMKYL